MDLPLTQYVDRDGAAMAYQVFGDGPFDIVHFDDAPGPDVDRPGHPQQL